MATEGYEIETDMNSSAWGIHKVDIIKFGSVVPYRIPSFSVVTVELKHAVCIVWDDSQDNVQQFDLFMRCSPDMMLITKYHAHWRSWKAAQCQ